MEITGTGRFREAWKELTEESKESGPKALRNVQDKGGL